MIDINGFEQYLYDEELSQNTRSSYMYALKNFAESFEEINKQNIVQWKNMLTETRSPKTVNLRLAALTKYCQYKSVGISIKRMKIQNVISVENVITSAQYDLLIQNLKKDNQTNMLIIIKLLAKTGGRISEVIKYRKKDLMKGYVDMKTKGKIRRIYFPESLVSDIMPVIKGCSENDFLCRNKFGRQITARGVSENLRRYASVYGIPKEVMHPHSFRHFFAVEFLKRNNNISLLADLLGHSGINTTRIYLRMSEAQQKAEIDKAVDW